MRSLFIMSLFFSLGSFCCDGMAIETEDALDAEVDYYTDSSQSVQPSEDQLVEALFNNFEAGFTEHMHKQVDGSYRCGYFASCYAAQPCNCHCATAYEAAIHLRNHTDYKPFKSNITQERFAVAYVGQEEELEYIPYCFLCYYEYNDDVDQHKITCPHQPQYSKKSKIPQLVRELHGFNV